MSRRAFFCLVCLAWLARASGADTIAFWNVPQRGANCFNEAPPDAAYFQALRAYGATWVRLTYSKWPSSKAGPAAVIFSFGNLDDYRALVREDLETLRAVLDRAHAAGLRVVLVPLELPGARWTQQNDGKFDDRLWNEPRILAPGGRVLARPGRGAAQSSGHRGLQPRQRAGAGVARWARRTRRARDHARLVSTGARHDARPAGIL